MESIKVFEAFYASLVCVGEGSFVVEKMGCDQQWKSDK
jgi:hypothetical protein